MEFDWITTIGIVAAILTTSSFLPQTIRIIRTKDTHGISMSMYLVFNMGVCLWLAYGILMGSLPIILANAVTLVFTLSILIMKLRYK